MIIAGILFFAVFIFFVGKFVLSRGILLNQGKSFFTHNVFFSRLHSGSLRLRARRGVLTDSFDLVVTRDEIDLLAFSCGHRPMDRRLDKAGYRVYRLIHWQNSAKQTALKTRIGDFTLHPKAQKRFQEFSDQLLDDQRDDQAEQCLRS